MAIQYSIQKMVSDGTLSTITLGIQYLQRNDIYIRIAGEETPQSGAASGYTWYFIDNTTLKILPVVPAGVEVVVYRHTDVDAMYNIYSQNAQFDEATVDENNQQLLYIAQEYLEQGIPGAGVDTIEFLRDDGTNTYYRIKRTDGSYSDEFAVPSAGTTARILAREVLRRSCAEAGLNLVSGSFEYGFTLVNPQDVALHEATAKIYSGIAGVYPPSTSTVGFKDKSNSLLRDAMRGVSHPFSFGAVGDGTYHPLSERYSTLLEAQAMYPHATTLSQSIDWAALQAALNAGTGTVDYRGGRYFVNHALTRTSSISLIGDKQSRIIMVGASFTIEGSLTALPGLATNVTTVSRTLSFSTTPSISGGATVLIFNPTAYSWSAHRSYYRAGEFFKVHSLLGNTASIYGLPSSSYIASEVEVYRVNGVAVTMQDVYIEGDADFTGAPMVVRFGVDVDIRGWRGSVSKSYQLEIDRCYCVDIAAGVAVNNSPFVDDEYGLLISNSSNVTVHCGNHFATRHAVALGGGSGTGAIPCRNIKIIGANLLNTSADVGAADMHGNCDNVQYIDCEINAHAVLGGRNGKYINCRIFQRTSPDDGACMYGSEIVGGQFDIIDCDLITQGNLNSYGAIHLSTVIPLKQDLTLKVRGLTVRGGAGGPDAKLIKVVPAVGETKKINVDARGVRCELTQALCVLFIRCDSVPSQRIASDGHIVDDIYGPAGMALIQNTGAALTGIPTRQMRQSSYVDVTTTVSTLAAASEQTFRYPYSKLPAVSVGVSSPSGSAISAIGGQPASPIMYSLSATQPRPAIVTPANMTAGVAVRLHWCAEISEI